MTEESRPLVKVRICTPSYDGKLPTEVVRCLITEQMFAAKHNIDLGASFINYCSNLPHARNQLVRDFLLSDDDRLVFLDADVAWEPGSLLKIALSPVDFVGGAPRYKQDFLRDRLEKLAESGEAVSPEALRAALAADEGYPIYWLDDMTPDPVTGFISVGVLPAGFLSISKNVFNTLFDQNRDRGGYNFAGANFFPFFEMRHGGGEDGGFCQDWIKAGGKVWLDPSLTLTHIGGSAPRYVGCVSDWLKTLPTKLDGQPYIPGLSDAA